MKTLHASFWASMLLVSTRKRTGLSSLAIEAGRVVSRKTGVDRRVVGFSGPQSSVRYKSSLEERVR